jgi:gamma-D-glutamyl-L-lysine dipeptidyl-peptidase
MPKIQNCAILLLALFLFGCSRGPQKTMVKELLKKAESSLAIDLRTTVFGVKAEIDGNVLTLRGDIHDSSLKARLIKYLQETTNLRIVDSLRTMPDPALGEKVFGIVSVSVANMRAKNAHSGEMVTQALLGMPVRLLKREKGWWRIQTPDDYLGWTKDMIARMDGQELEQWARRPKVMVTEAVGFLRQSKDPRSPVVSDFVAGDLFVLEAEEGDYFRVMYPDGRTAYLPRRSGEKFDAWLKKAKDTPENIQATAQRFFGVPYLWGGTSVKGMDCSGFVRTVYFLNGTLLPRDASQQWMIGEKVDTSGGLSALKTGDLVFFKDTDSAGTSLRIDHVGIYLDRGRFIHTPSSQAFGVRLNSLLPGDPVYDAYYPSALAGVRRIAGASSSTGVRRLAEVPFYNGRGYEH